MFKGPKPSGQPRTVRTIAESQNGGGGFMDVPPSPLGSDVYQDDAANVRPTVSGPRPMSRADKQPFTVRGS